MSGSGVQPNKMIFRITPGLFADYCLFGVLFFVRGMRTGRDASGFINHSTLLQILVGLSPEQSAGISIAIKAITRFICKFTG